MVKTFLVLLYLFNFNLLYLYSADDKKPLDEINVLLIEKQSEFRREIEEKIKNNILDPILGKDKAFVFADVNFDIITKKQEQAKEGVGVLQQYKEKGSASNQGDTDFILPGIPKPKSILSPNERPEAAHGTQTQQSKAIEAIKFSAIAQITRFQVTVLHDKDLDPNLLAVARQRIDDFLLPYKINGQDPPLVIFKPTEFKKIKRNIWDDLQKPSVYLPLLYALLFLLLLLYLFGPLWSFLRKYLKAIMEKPGAEVNIEDNRGEEGEEGKGEEVQEGHQQIDMNFMQKEEEEKAEEEEEDEMKKFEPFSYINEENLKRLVYLFLLRKEEPWIIAVVLSYLKPELSKQAFAMLPVELQAKVALESLKVKQATKEQIEAIDKDIKENVDFVMGGVEQLLKIIEEADAQTRNNVLEYLKTQKPDIYEKLKSVLLTFDDIVSFSDKDVQMIIRNVSNEDLAKALKGATPEVSEKLFKNMSSGAANTIREIMDYMGEPTRAQIDEAQMKILDTVKRLEAEGKIASYRRNEAGNIYILDSSDVTSGASREEKISKAQQQSQETSAEIQQYLSAGIDFYNQGDYQNAVSYLQYVTSADPQNQSAWQYLGSAYYAMGDYQNAVNAYETYVNLSGDQEFRSWLDDLKRQLGM